MRVAGGDIIVLLEDTPGLELNTVDRMLKIARRSAPPDAVDIGRNLFTWKEHHSAAT
jgi:hypothetical protein